MGAGSGQHASGWAQWFAGRTASDIATRLIVALRHYLHHPIFGALFSPAHCFGEEE